MCNNNSGYWQERACNNSTGNSNGCFPTFSLKSYRFLNIIDLECENYTLPSQKHDWGFYPVYLPDACLGMEMLNFLQKFAKHKHCISLSNSLFCSQITAHLFCLEKKPSDILPKCCSLTLHGIRAQKQVVEWATKLRGKLPKVNLSSGISTPALLGWSFLGLNWAGQWDY